MKSKHLSLIAVTIALSLLAGLKVFTAFSFLFDGLAASSTLIGLSALVAFGLLAIASLEPVRLTPASMRVDPARSGRAGHDGR